MYIIDNPIHNSKSYYNFLKKNDLLHKFFILSEPELSNEINQALIDFNVKAYRKVKSSKIELIFKDEYHYLMFDLTWK